MRQNSQLVITNQLRFSILLMLIFFVVGCNSGGTEIDSGYSSEAANGEAFDVSVASERDSLILHIPELEPVKKGSNPIKVVATTSIVGDVVSQIGSQFIDLVVLMEPGQDPHSFISSVSDLRSVAESDVIFVGGWDLEEGLITDLHSVSDSPQVPVTAGIKPRLLPGAYVTRNNELERANPDPHTWLDPRMVVQWVNNISDALSELDPDNSESYQLNAETYIEKLNELIDLYESTIDTLDPNRKKLVTNHDALGYLADAYQIEVIGSILPSGSSLAEPSARELADIVRLIKEARICTIFTETSSNNNLAGAVAGELDHCPSVRIVDLYTGSLGPEGGEADTYIKMMEINIRKIEQGLQ